MHFENEVKIEFTLKSPKLSIISGRKKKKVIIQTP